MLCEFTQDTTGTSQRVFIKKGAVLEVHPEHDMSHIRFNPKTMQSITHSAKGPSCIVRKAFLKPHVSYVEVFNAL